MIEFKNLKKSFGSREILKGISFSISTGKILFILGTSGTGKSVLLKNVVGLLRPDSGEILLNSVDITKLSEEEYLKVRKDCGMVFQHPALFDSLSIFENIAFGLRRHYREMPDSQIEERVLKCLSMVQLQKNILPLLPSEISYGMQKRVSLARTIALEPKFLLFDEPTTGLDPITTNAVNQLIFDLSRSLNTTSIVVSHDMQCALAIADYIIVLDKGQIVDQGSPEELRHSKQELVIDFLAEALAHENAK